MLVRLFGGGERRSINGVPWLDGTTVPSPMQDAGSFISPTRISETAALRVATVWRCIWSIADPIAAAPIDVFRKEGEVRRQVATPSVLADPAAGAMSPHDWKFALIAGALLTGNGYAFKAGLDRAGYPTSLPLLDPTQVRPKVSGARIESFSYNGEDLPADRVLHLRAFTLPGKPLGIGPLEQFGATIGMAVQAEKFAYQFFTEGGIPSGIVYSEKELTRQQAIDIKARIIRSWRGRREPAVLGKGLKYERVSVNPSEAQFVESQHFTIEEICRIFGVQPRKVGHAMSGSSITYANIEQSQLDHQIDAVFPWSSRLEAVMSSVLPKPQFAKLNLDAQVRVDLITRYKAHGMSLRDGWDTADHRRALEDMEPLPDGQGNVALWPLVAKPTQEPEAPQQQPDQSGIRYGGSSS